MKRPRNLGTRRRSRRCRRVRFRLAAGRRHCIDRRVRLCFARSCWRRIHHSRIAFLFLSGRIRHGRLFLFASRQQCQSSEKTNVFLHTYKSNL